MPPPAFFGLVAAGWNFIHSLTKKQEEFDLLMGKFLVPHRVPLALAATDAKQPLLQPYLLPAQQLSYWKGRECSWLFGVIHSAAQLLSLSLAKVYAGSTFFLVSLESGGCIVRISPL